MGKSWGVQEWVEFSNSLVPTGGDFPSPKDSEQCLETFMIVTTAGREYS